uniref:Peptidase M16C associated domain-containing protein n=1 Tax=Clastoptera arizonana TaxID=38151 RepID=A0A1B6DB00_9HEMI
MIQFENVPIEKLTKVRSKLSEVLENIASGKDSIDMCRLSTVVNRHRLECLSHLENSPHDSIAFMAIGDMLYGNSEQDFDQRLNQVKELQRMEKEEMSFWVNILKQYLIDRPSVTVRGIPSLKEQHRMTEKEQARVEMQRLNLGPTGLKEKESILTKAIEQNEVAPPEHILTSIKIPSIDSINFHPIKTYTTDSEEQHDQFDASKAPVYMQVDHILTNFVYMFVLMDTNDVSNALRPYLLLLFESLLESPIERDGKIIPYEEVVAQLEADTVAAVTRIGLESSSRFHCGPYSQTASLMLQLEPEKYEKGIIWIKDLLYHTKLTVERLKIIASKIVNDVAQVKRKGNSAVRDLMKGLLYNQESNHYSCSVLRQYKFLTNMLDRLNNPDECNQVLAEIDTVRQIVTHPSNIVIHHAANLDLLAAKVSDPADLWKQVLPYTKSPVKNKLNVTSDWTLLNSESNTLHSCVVGMGAVESTFFCQTTPAIKDFLDPDLAPLLVFLQYLTQLEGPMWRQIRGMGLAYSYNIIPRPNENMLYLTFYRATNVVGAYKEAKAIVESKLCDNIFWEKPLFDSAKSSLIFEIIEREKSIGDVVAQSLLSYFKNVDHNYNRWLVELISNVTTEDLCRVGPRYVTSLFDPKNSKTTLVCHPSKVDEVVNGFKDLGLDLKPYSCIEDSFLNEWIH